MRAKTVTLYSLPYAVAIASILAGAQQVGPTLRSIDAPAARDRHVGQTVNRALKGDRLPVRPATPQIPDRAGTARSPLKPDVVVDPATA
jgi:hypothetical protein